MPVSAGKANPVENEIDKIIDLNEFLVEHPAATFFARIKGDTLKDAGINDDDILIVDTVLEPKDGKIVIASVNGDMTVKIYRFIDGVEYLQSQKDHFMPMKIEPYLEFVVVGVVTKVIHSL
jgi:DNA polymerase V